MILTWICLCLIPCISQENFLPGIVPEHLPGLTIESSDQFIGPALWGYINGGADLYFEYGFKQVRAQKLTYKGKQYSVDIFQMSDSEAAFGIFSISHYECDEKKELYICKTSYQLQLVKDRYYISIVNETGSPEEQATCEKLGQILISQTGSGDYIYPELFMVSPIDRFIQNIKVIKGRLGLENGYPSWVEYFEGIKDFTITLVPCSFSEGHTNVAIIRFEKTSSCDTFLKGMGLFNPNGRKNDSTVSHQKIFKELTKNQILFVEATEGTIFADEILQWLE